MMNLQSFLDTNWDGKSPLLLGYSGGPDSKALLYLLLELGVRPHVAHVDHGWREESRSEAEAIGQEMAALGLVFHTTRLAPNRSEEVARDGRWAFFRLLFQKTPYQALLLAHQADDWAETALKRTLEGAHLVHLAGMKGVSERDSVAIWRPLLKVSKAELVSYLKKRGLGAIRDATNFDPIYLRARMRGKILPALSQSFGKEVGSNLVCLAERSEELKGYLDRQTEEVMKGVQVGPWGLRLPLLLPEKTEIRHALQRTGLFFSRQVLEGVTQAIAEKRLQQIFDRRMIADRGCFYYLSEALPQFGDPIEVRVGQFCSGNWCLEITEGDGGNNIWPSAWSGHFSFVLPNQKFVLERKKNRSPNSLIPPFFRSLMPSLLSERRPPGEKPHFLLRFSVDSNLS